MREKDLMLLYSVYSCKMIQGHEVLSSMKGMENRSLDDKSISTTWLSTENIACWLPEVGIPDALVSGQGLYHVLPLLKYRSATYLLWCLEYLKLSPVPFSFQ